MKLQSFKRPDIVDFTTSWEKRTLDGLATQTGADPMNSIRNSLHGKNSPRAPIGTCDPEGRGSWSLTGDGCLLALTDMALRWDHGPVLQYLARMYSYAISICPWWLQTFNTLPGEYAALEPCWSRSAIKAKGDKGDTDLWRHYGSLGLLRLGIEPKIKERGSWSDADVLALTDLHFNFVSGSVTRLGQGEFLRMSYKADMLLGCMDVYESITHPGNKLKAKQCWDMVTTFWRWYLPDAIWVKPADQNGDERPLFSYGPWEMDSRRMGYKEPWNYGYYPFGGQSWYYGHVAQSLIQAAFRALKRGDRVFFQYALRIVLKIADWCDPRMRKTAPRVPLRSPTDSVNMCNTLIHGGKEEGSAHGYATDQAYAVNGGVSNMLTLDKYESLRGATPFYRHLYADKYLHIDGGVWETSYRDPGGNIHPRKKWSNGSFTPKKTSLDSANAHGLLSALWAKALVFNDVELTRWLEIWMAETYAFPHTTDQVVRLSQSIEGMESGLNNVGVPGRMWQWVIKGGWEGRSMMVGSQGGGKGSLDELMTFASKVTGGMVIG